MRDVQIAAKLDISKSALAERAEGIVKKIKKATGLGVTNLRKLAIECAAAGWDANLKLNQEIIDP